MVACIVAGCQQAEVKARGLCSRHYQWARLIGILDTFPKLPRTPKVTRSCEVPGCVRSAHHGSICSMHSERRRLTGSVGEASPRTERSRSPVCSLAACERKTYARGFCNLHWQRAKKTGDPGQVGLKKRPDGSGSIELGYLTFRVDNKRKAEHRMVWEAANGPIPPRHVIHHRNGNKLDNRLENLELMTREQHRRHHHEDIEAARKSGRV